MALQGQNLPTKHNLPTGFIQVSHMRFTGRCYLRFLTSFVFDISKSDFMPVPENIISYCIVSLFTNLFFFFSLMNENYRRHIFEQRKRIRDLSSLFPRTVQLNTTTTRRSRAQLFGSSLTTKPMGANWVEKQPVKEKEVCRVHQNVVETFNELEFI